MEDQRHSNQLGDGSHPRKDIGKAVNEIEVKLLANGKEVQTAKLNEANSWKHTFKDLPVYDDNGKEITYTVKEVAIEGYESTIEGNAWP